MYILVLSCVILVRATHRVHSLLIVGHLRLLGRLLCGHAKLLDLFLELLDLFLGSLLSGLGLLDLFLGSLLSCLGLKLLLFQRNDLLPILTGIVLVLGGESTVTAAIVNSISSNCFTGLGFVGRRFHIVQAKVIVIALRCLPSM